MVELVKFQLRLMTLRDVPFADLIRNLAGWNQTLDDWHRFLDMEPEGCFVAECAGTIAGTATTLTYNHEIGWIGMVLVHPDFRRRGIGSELLKQCIAYLQKRGVGTIKLDATPLGQCLYRALGFQTEWNLHRWERVHFQRLHAQGPSVGLRKWQTGDAASVAALDQAAFGVSRHALIEALAEESLGALVFESGQQALEGYALIRDGAKALYLGPVVASSHEVARMLVGALMAQHPARPVFWDIPEQNLPATRWAAEMGFAVQRALTRMYLGTNLAPGDPLRQFAIAGPELG